MKIKSSRGMSHVSINPRREGEGVVINQRSTYVLLSWNEWDEMVEQGNAIRETQKPRKKYRMA